MNRITSFVRLILSHSVTRNSLIVLTGSMFANFLAYLYHLAVGRILGPEKYGELAALLSLMYLLNVPSQGVQTVLVKYFSGIKARQKTGEAKSLFLLSSKWLLVSVLIGFIIIFPFINLLTDFLHIASKEYFFWLYLIFAAFILSVVQASIFQGYQLFITSNILANVGAALRLALGAAGAFLGVGATLLSNVLSNIITYCISLFPLRFIFRARTEPINISKRHILGYSIPTLITTLGVIALYSQDVILVKHFFPARDAGIYSSLSVLGKVIFFASSALGFVLFPVVAERKELNKGHKQIVWSGLLAIAGISLTLTAFYFLFPKLVVDLLFGSAYHEAIPYLGYFGLFITFFSLSSLLSSVCLATDKTKVWILAVFASFIQLTLIWLYHHNLITVIWINLAVTAAFFFSLLLYYGYAKDKS